MAIISDTRHGQIKNAAKALNAGHLVAFPTETVYGLGADATNREAISRIYSVKGRPSDHPLIIHISSISMIDKWATNVPEYALKLAREFWPGPMTLILAKNILANNFSTGGQSQIALRVPNHPVALKLLLEFEKVGGLGISAPSANRFGAVSPTSVPDVLEELDCFLNDKDVILDGGACEIGIESTIIDCTQLNPKILRNGVVTAEAIEEVLGLRVKFNHSSNKLRSSGMFDSHYSPRAQVLLDSKAYPYDGFIAMENIKTPVGAIRLLSPKTIEEYARNIYAALRLADQKKISRIIVIQPKGKGTAVAIRERLLKASAK